MRIVSFAVLIMLLNGLWAGLTNLPQDVGLDVPEGKLKSLSFAPFRAGQGPVQGIYPTPEQIEADLKLISRKTHNIRTYASSEGNMPKIPELAGKYGLTMLQGAWLNAPNVLQDKNKAEIAELIRSANAHPDVVKRVIVGNEVLLRYDLTVEQLIGYIREVKRSVKQPVSYADAWSMYMAHPELIKEVDFITIHILPYWNDRPIAADEAPAHIERMIKDIKQQANAIAPNKPILIGESGWPSAGRQRGSAIPSVVNEARFIRAFIKVAADNGIDYNIVESFNQTWKSAFEGVAGGNWGLYSADRQEVFPLIGKVYENPQWHKALIASGIIFLMVTLRFWQSLQNLSSARLLIFLGFLQLLAVLLVSQMQHLWVNPLQIITPGDKAASLIRELESFWHNGYSDIEHLQTAVIVGLSIVLGGLVLRRGYALLADQTTSQTLSGFLYKLYGLFSLFALYKTYQLAVDGRYFSFPSAATYIAVVGLMGLIVIRTVTQSHWAWRIMAIDSLIGNTESKFWQNKMLGSALVLMGLALIAGETHSFMVKGDLIVEQPEFWIRLRVCLGFTLANCQLLGWLASLTVLAVPFLIGEAEKSAVS